MQSQPSQMGSPTYRSWSREGAQSSHDSYPDCQGKNQIRMHRLTVLCGLGQGTFAPSW
jgi:hypothetical protein